MLCCTSCNDSAVDGALSSNGNWQVLITNPPGDDHLLGGQNSLDGMPWIWGGGVIHTTAASGVPVLLLGKNLNNDQTVEIEPMGMFQVKYQEDTIRWVIGNPLEPDLRWMNAGTFYEFQKECFSCKGLVEDWLINYYGSEEAIYIGWNNEQDADLFLRTLAE